MQIAIEPPLRLGARASYRSVGILCTIFATVVGVFSVLAALLNLDGSFPQPIPFAIGFAVGWGLMVLLGIYLWLFAMKYQLEISSEGITQIGVFSHKSLLYRDITIAKWRKWPGYGSLKVESHDGKLTIDLDNVPSEWRDTLINLLHAMIPSAVQIQWETFHNREIKRANPSPSSRRRTSILFYALAVPLVVAWWMGLGAGNLVVAVINVVFATYHLLGKPRNSEHEPKQP